jgi:O-acetylserine/cysteine efflux transporter
MPASPPPTSASRFRQVAIWLPALAGLTLVWGLSIPATKLGLTDTPPLTFTAARYVCAAPLFALLLLRRRLPRPRDLVALAGLGALGIAFGQSAQTLGVRGSSATVATVLSAMIPMFVVIGAALREGQAVRPRHIAGLVIAFTGVALVSWQDAPGGRNTLAGNALIMASALGIAAYYVYAMALTRRYGAIVVAGWSCIAGAVLLLPIAAWDWGQMTAAPSLRTVAVILYLAALVTVAGLWLFMRALQAVPARIAAGSQYLQPIVGVAASAALFGDPLGPRFVAGAALVIAGIALTAWPQRSGRNKSGRKWTQRTQRGTENMEKDQ